MKKLVFLFVAFAAVSLASCGNKAAKNAETVEAVCDSAKACCDKEHTHACNDSVKACCDKEHAHACNDSVKACCDSTKVAE